MFAAWRALSPVVGAFNVMLLPDIDQLNGLGKFILLSLHPIHGTPSKRPGIDSVVVAVIFTDDNIRPAFVADVNMTCPAGFRQTIP